MSENYFQTFLLEKLLLVLMFTNTYSQDQTNINQEKMQITKEKKSWKQLDFYIICSVKIVVSMLQWHILDAMTF